MTRYDHRHARLPRAAWLAPLVLAPLLAVAACAEDPVVRINAVELQAAQRINDDFPVAVDLVLISDETLAGEMLELTAADWFTKKKQYMLDYPEQVLVKSWEVVPGQTLRDVITDQYEAAWTGVVFANYAAPGAHRYRIQRAADTLVLRLERDDAMIVIRQPE